MIVRAGAPVSFAVMFSSGHPDGNIAVKVLGPNGTALNEITIAPEPDAVSVLVSIAGQHTLLGDGELQSYRDVTWSYTVNGLTVHSEKRFTIEARLPFGVSPDGVRRKLGVDSSNLGDDEISLVTAYYDFQEIVGEEPLAAARLDAGRTQLVVKDAIEAYAALALLPTMVVRVANKESSGTNQYQRQKIDWSSVQLALEALVGAGQEHLLPGFDSTIGFGSLLILATPETDPFPGA